MIKLSRFPNRSGPQGFNALGAAECKTGAHGVRGGGSHA